MKCSSNWISRGLTLVTVMLDADRDAIGELRVIERVVELGAELHVDAFGDFRSAPQSRRPAGSRREEPMYPRFARGIHCGPPDGARGYFSTKSRR
jgi:hypothetical protein